MINITSTKEQIPYKPTPTMMMMYLVGFVKMWHNAAPENSELYRTLIPCVIIYRKNISFSNQFRTTFVSR